MGSLGDLFGSIGLNFAGGGWGMVGTIAAVFIGVFGLIIAIGFVWWIIRKKKNWNIKVEFRLPRDVREDTDGTVIGTITKEWGKGYYDSKKGVVHVKRKGRKPVSMKPFDIKRYLSSSSILTVIQVGIEDYRPVLDESYLEVFDDTTGEEAALIKAHIDTSEGKSWKSSFERDSKSAYSLQKFWQQHGDKIMWGLIILIILVGQAIVITRLD